METNEAPRTIGGETIYPQSLVAEQLGCTIRTLENWRNRRVGPAWTKIGHRVYYREASIVEWIRQQERKSVGEAA